MNIKERSIEWLEDRKKELEPLRDECHSITNELDRRRRDALEKERISAFNQIAYKTKYVAPEYPDMGVVAVNGSCELKNKEDAQKLTDVLKRKSSWCYSYSLRWDGPGKYIIIPETRRDHNYDISYHASFRKEVDETA